MNRHNILIMMFLGKSVLKYMLGLYSDISYFVNWRIQIVVCIILEITMIFSSFNNLNEITAFDLLWWRKGRTRDWLASRVWAWLFFFYFSLGKQMQCRADELGKDLSHPWILLLSKMITELQKISHKGVNFQFKLQLLIHPKHWNYLQGYTLQSTSTEPCHSEW